MPTGWVPVKLELASVICCSVLPPSSSAVYFYCVFNLYSFAWVWMSTLGPHTHGVGSPHLRLSQVGHTARVLAH